MVDIMREYPHQIDLLHAYFSRKERQTRIGKANYGNISPHFKDQAFNSLGRLKFDQERVDEWQSVVKLFLATIR